MADDLRRNLINKSNKCPAVSQQSQNAASARKGFFGSLGKIGDIEALNEIGAGDIGEGLRTVASISDSIRTGQGAVPSVFGDATSALDAKANAVLEAQNIDPKSLNFAANFSPDVANRAYEQAQVVGDLVSRGDFSFDDIPSFIQEFTAADQLIRSIFTDADGDKGPKSFDLCTSPYAVDLIRYAPKYKFLFLLEIKFNAAYTALTNSEFWFVIKNSTRPDVSFDYEEVNMYNFRTKIPKRATYEQMSMRFYDDNLNNAMNFYTAYMRAMSPIANVSFSQGVQGNDYEESGMDFRNFSSGKAFTTETPADTTVNSASIGALQGNHKTIIREIKLHHIFNYGKMFNTYTFYNPRITKLGLDELDMADNGNGNEMMFDFEYDGLYVSPNRKVAEANNRNLIENVSGAWQGALFPIKPTFQGNIPGGEQQTGNGYGIPSDVPNSNRVPSGDQQESIVGAAVSSVSSAVGGFVDGATNLVSDAFRSGSLFIGSVFSGPRKLD